MKLILLGSGIIMYQLARSIINAGHEILAVGTNSNDNLDNWQLGRLNICPNILSGYEEVDRFNVDTVVMYSYAPLIDKEILKNNRFINIHYALLPRYRGFHGFYWSMINDEPQMGYTVHAVDQGIDSGPIYYQYGVEVTDTQNINDIRQKLDAHLVCNIGRYISGIEKGKIAIMQNENEAVYVTKRKPEDGLIDWNWSARRVFNHIRALTPPATPGAYSFYQGKKIIFTKARWMNVPIYFMKPGKVVSINSDNSIFVKCGDSILNVTEIYYGDKLVAPGKVVTRIGEQLGI